MIQAAAIRAEVFLMRVGWSAVGLVVLVSLGISALFSEQPVLAVAPQSAALSAPATRPHTAASAADVGLSIPDTTLAINGPKPLSERVVHYEIDAKYDAGKHTVDAT